MSADSPRCHSRGIAVPAVVPPQVVSDRSILDSAIGFISDVTLVTNQTHTEPKDTIIWARFETASDLSDPCFGIDWELEGNVAPPLLLILGYGLGVQVWAIPANGEAIEVLSWRHGVVSTLRVLPTPACVRSTDEHGRADEIIDAYAEKRPLIALVDTSTTSTQPQFCTLNFISLKTGKQVKTIKFKNPILDIIANRTSVVAVFHERIAVFDARTLEDRLSITTCYPSPGINPNPVALGQRWLAYAEQKLLPSKRSGGGWDGEGIASYTATVLNAAKSFGKGLRELGEQVAAGFTGTTSAGSLSKNSSFESNTGIDVKQPGIVTIMDIEQTVKDYSPTSTTVTTSSIGNEPIVAHFIAHSEAIVAMEFDNSGMLLLTADRRGHDFHVFRIQPHPISPSLSAVHHLYVLHRGDTSAKVQNITFSLDSRWVAISTLRGTTHVFPITPYGGPMGVRTHTSLHVVNKLSRFHRSAGLSADGRSNSPITHSESTTFMQSLQPYHNTTLPPFPRPTVVLPLAQLRQPFALGSPPVSAGLVMPGKIGASSGGTTNASQRQRHSSLSDDNGKPLSVCAIFAKSRSWLLEPPNVTREASHRIQRKAIDSLFIMAGHGALIQYDLDTKLASNIAKEKICDDTPIELEVEAKAQWNLGRRRDGSHEIMPPLSNDNWLLKDSSSCLLLDSMRQYEDIEEKSESWVSQVEIITHAGPHRRLWMGPQCVFKTYNTPSGSNLNHVDVEAVEIGVSKTASTTTAMRSHPLSMPVAAARCNLPVLIESGSYSSIEQSPKLMDRFRHEHLDSDFTVAHGDSRLKEDLADAMRESPSVSEIQKNTCRIASEVASSDNVSFYDARTDPDICDDDSDHNPKAMASYPSSLATTTEKKQPDIIGWNLVSNIDYVKNRTAHLCSNNSFNRQTEILKTPKASVENVVNPLGTVTTVISGISSEVRRDILDEVVSQLAAEDDIIHENCDESLFRPVVAIFCDEREREAAQRKDAIENEEFRKPPEIIKNKLVVPVIAKEVDAELSKREKNQKSEKIKMQNMKSLSNQCKLDERKSNDNTLTDDKTDKNEQTEKSNNDKVIQIEQPSDSSKDLSQNNGTIQEKKEMDNCEHIKELTTTENKTKIGNVKKTNIKPIVVAEEEEEPIAFKRMTPIPISKNRKQFPTLDSKSPSTEQSTGNECKTITKGKQSNEIRKTSKAAEKMSSPNQEHFVEEKQICPTGKLEQVNYKMESLPEQTDISNISEKNLMPSKSIESSDISNNTISKIQIDNIQSQKIQTIEKESPKVKQKYANLLDNHGSSQNNDKKNEQCNSKEQAKVSKDLSTKDIKKKCKLNESTLSSDVKKITETDNDNMNIYTIKVFETSEIKKQGENSKVKSFENEKVKDNQSKQNKKIDAKSTSAIAIDGKQISNQEQNKQIECKNVRKKDDVVDGENSKNKANKSKLNTDKAMLPSPIESPPITFNADIFEENESKKSDGESGITAIAVDENKKIDQSLQLNLKNCTSLQISKPSHSVWKAVDSVEGFVEKNENFPSLGAMGKNKKLIKNKDNITEKSENILPHLPTTMKHTQKLDSKVNVINESKSESKWSSSFEAFPALQALEALPPLPALEPLDITPFSTVSKKNKTQQNKDDMTNQSLINFDSPLQENPKPNKIGIEESTDCKHRLSNEKEEQFLSLEQSSHYGKTTIEKLSQKNLILALCGSLHYENDNECTDDKSEIESNIKSGIGSEKSEGEYKLLNENEEQFLSLEQRSHNANTINVGKTTKEKFSSSSNSSASEEIIVIEEKKMSKKQRKKKQQMESKKQKGESERHDDDEELLPLIGMTDSQIEIVPVRDSNIPSTSLVNTNNNIKDVQMQLEGSVILKPVLITRASPLGHSTTTTTTTDSEGPIPATTSDDNNIFILPTNVTTTNPPIKLKTKRLEHKINLMAAIDAATSSSTSSAEESNVEAENRKAGSDQELPILGINTSSSSQVQSTLTNVSLVTQQCATKKKTKRRKR